MNIKRNVETIQKVLIDYPNTNIVAAVKYIDETMISSLYDAGIKHMGENRVESLIGKYEANQDLDIVWHFIGTLQTKKVKKVIDKIEYLHSLDRFSLAQEIQKRAKKVIKCFVQVNISNEDSKHGLEYNEVINFIHSLKDYDTIEVVGLMGMASFEADEKELRQTFEKLLALRKQVQALNLPYAPCSELSMGMSNDFMIALEYEATFIRIGSILFQD